MTQESETLLYRDGGTGQIKRVQIIRGTGGRTEDTVELLNTNDELLTFAFVSSTVLLHIL